jgi:hypothetical protein
VDTKYSTRSDARSCDDQSNDVLSSAIFGTIFGLIIVACFDLQAVLDKGFFQGYTLVVWIVIVLQVRFF